MEDTISRKAAIEALQEHRNLFCDNTPETFSVLPYGDKCRVDELDMAIATLINLPSAQEKRTEERTETHGMCLDAISRQDAIDAMGKVQWAKVRLMDLPSAQPELIRINLNEPIKVKLTDWGKEIYYHQYDRTNQIAGREICKPRFPREDENGYTEFQLWCFIELYGMHMGMTLPNVIEPLEIVYER